MENSINNKEGDLLDLVEFVFKNGPKPEKSIHVVLENHNLEELYKSLLMFFTECMKILYGDASGKVDLNNL